MARMSGPHIEDPREMMARMSGSHITDPRERYLWCRRALRELFEVTVAEFGAKGERLDGGDVESVEIKMIRNMISCGSVIVDNADALLTLQELYPSLVSLDEQVRRLSEVCFHAEAIGLCVDGYVGARGALLAAGVPVCCLAFYDLHVDDVEKCDVDIPEL
jgi:hypothetical protein